MGKWETPSAQFAMRMHQIWVILIFMFICCQISHQGPISRHRKEISDISELDSSTKVSIQHSSHGPDREWNEDEVRAYYAQLYSNQGLARQQTWFMSFLTTLVIFVYFMVLGSLFLIGFRLCFTSSSKAYKKCSDESMSSLQDSEISFLLKNFHKDPYEKAKRVFMKVKAFLTSEKEQRVKSKHSIKDIMKDDLKENKEDNRKKVAFKFKTPNKKKSNKDWHPKTVYASNGEYGYYVTEYVHGAETATTRRKNKRQDYKKPLKSSTLDSKLSFPKSQMFRGGFSTIQNHVAPSLVLRPELTERPYYYGDRLFNGKGVVKLKYENAYSKAAILKQLCQPPVSNDYERMYGEGADSFYPEEHRMVKMYSSPNFCHDQDFQYQFPSLQKQIYHCSAPILYTNTHKRRSKGKRVTFAKKPIIIPYKEEHSDLIEL